jgi:hypothetical protein
MYKLSVHIVSVMIGLAIFNGCNEKEDNNQEYIVIDVPETVSSDESLFDYTSKIEIVPLEYTGEESLISSIKKIIVRDKIFIINSYPRGEKSLMIFNLNGDFISNSKYIESKALVESHIKDFMISDENILLVLDQNNNLLQVSENLEYLSHIELPFAATDIYPLGDQLLFYTNGIARNFQPDSLMFNIIVVDKDYTINRRFNQFTVLENTGMTHSKLFGNIFSRNGQALYNEFSNDTIFVISKNHIEPKYVIDFGAQGFAKEDYPNAEVNALSPILKNNHNWGIGHIVSNKDFMSFTYNQKDVPILLLYNKNSGDITYFNPFKTMNNENLVPAPKFYDGEYFYGFFQESGLGLLENVDDYSENSIMYKVYNHIKLNSNPVIVKYKLESNN